MTTERRWRRELLELPIRRLERSYRNLGIPISRSTLRGLSHRGADELRALHNAALKIVPTASDVHADETGIRQQYFEGRSSIHARADRLLLRAASQWLRTEAVLGDSYSKVASSSTCTSAATPKRSAAPE